MSKKHVAAFDGSATPNPGQMKIGGYIRLDRTNVFSFSKDIGQGTNNIAEYAALLTLVRAAREKGIQNIYIQGDSQLVINQVNGIWKARDPRMKQYKDRVLSVLKDIEHWELKHVKRAYNKIADSLTR
jgi:ribonuclease HI